MNAGSNGADKRLGWFQFMALIAINAGGGLWFAKGAADSIDQVKTTLAETRGEVKEVVTEQKALSTKVDTLLASQERIEEHQRGADHRLDQIETSERQRPATQWRRD